MEKFRVPPSVELYSPIVKLNRNFWKSSGKISTAILSYRMIFFCYCFKIEKLDKYYLRTWKNSWNFECHLLSNYTLLVQKKFQQNFYPNFRFWNIIWKRIVREINHSFIIPFKSKKPIIPTTVKATIIFLSWIDNVTWYKYVKWSRDTRKKRLHTTSVLFFVRDENVISL